MNRESYPAAQQVAPKVHAHFQTHMAAARERGVVPGAILPPPEVIERIINAAFWASLRREEGYVPKISIAYLPQEQDPKRLSFERSLPLTPPALAKVAPVVERAGIHLGVWHEGADVITGQPANVGQWLCRSEDEPDVYHIISDWTDEPSFRDYEQSREHLEHRRTLHPYRLRGSMATATVLAGLKGAAAT